MITRATFLRRSILALATTSLALPRGLIASPPRRVVGDVQACEYTEVLQWQDGSSVDAPRILKCRSKTGAIHRFEWTVCESSPSGGSIRVVLPLSHRIMSDGREVELEEGHFRCHIVIPRRDINGCGNLERIDQIVVIPLERDAVATWREVTCL